MGDVRLGAVVTHPGVMPVPFVTSAASFLHTLSQEDTLLSFLGCSLADTLLRVGEVAYKTYLEIVYCSFL